MSVAARSSQPSAARRGFTLIEMLVVIAILVVLAGLVLPKLDKVDLLSKKAVAANNAAEVARYTQTYKILHNEYPDGWDSLLDVGGTAPALWKPGAPITGAAGLDPEMVGGPPGTISKLSTYTISDPTDSGVLRSLQRMGITTVYDLDSTALAGDSPGDDFTIARTLADGDTVAILNAVSSGTQPDEDAAGIAQGIYPTLGGYIPADKVIVALGFGPRNTAISDVVMTCPFYPNTNPKQYYDRFVAFFAADVNGERAELKTVVGADGDTIDGEIFDYYNE